MNAQDLFECLADMPPGRPALIGMNSVLDHAALLREVSGVSARLRERGTRVFATMLDNGLAWGVADLAALRQRVVHVPIPAFFTPQQTTYVLDAAGVDTILSAGPVSGFETESLDLAGERLAFSTRNVRSVPVHQGTAKITFTSGSTGTPKGVCLSDEAMLAVARGLANAMAPLSVKRHLCALPLAILLENIAGLYAPLLAGATSVVVPCVEAGLEGSSRFDPSRLDAAVRRFEVQSVIVLPQMLRAWTGWRARHASDRATGLCLVAAGGASVGAAAIEQARASGLPAYEGYGLSEGASVQTLNLPVADRAASVGRPLPHARLRVASDGEIEIAGSLMLGYLGESRYDGEWWPTGDLGAIDADGFVQIRGRRKHVIVTAYGRNVSPEWVESLLHAHPAVAHAVVQGDGRPALEAVLWPAHEAVRDRDLEEAIAQANASLPDYARVVRFVRGRMPYAAAAGVCTPNGRPRRPAIQTLHAAAFAAHQKGLDVIL